MNTLIWYDGTKKSYFSGTIHDFEKAIKVAGSKNSFQVIYEFERESDRQVPRILESLNAARNQDRRSQK